jgi:hypothetical protein
VPKPPPTREEILDQLRRTTDANWHEPIVDDPGGAVAQFRGWARANAEVAKVAGRAASRQFFVTPPGYEPAGFGVRASASITIERSQDLDTTLIAAPGALSFAGPNGRVYRTTGFVGWFGAPNPNPAQIAYVECDLVGEPGNLEFYADDDGKLTDPETGLPQTSVLDFEDLSQGRVGTKGVLAVGPPSTLTDDGTAPTFAPTDVGLHVRIVSAGDPANKGRLLRITKWEIAETPGPFGFYPRTITLDDAPQSYLVTAAIQDDGGVFTDYTGAAQAGVADTVPLLPAAPAVGDAFYFGADRPFESLEIQITTRRYGDLTLAWEWWDGALWQPLADLEDGSEAFTVEGVAEVRFTPDAGWAITTIDARTAYFVRARVSVFVSQIVQPLAGRVVTLIPDPLVVDPLDANGDGQITWAIQDYGDLGLVITDMPAPSGGRDDDLGLKLLERQLRRRPGESLDALRRRAGRFPDVVTPEAITWEINRLLEPLGLAGKVCDLADGYTGLFWDVPTSFAPENVGAWDLYGPGDLFPTDQTLLQLSEAEARWHFFVCVTPSGLGEFGAAWDEGPPAYYADAFGTFLDSAWDFGFFDGYPYTAAEAYKSVWDRVNAAKACGFAFTMVQADVPTCP